jgi:hypothetical protein
LAGQRPSAGTRSTAAGPPAGTHEWLSFPDPEENRTWLFDVTFLLSPWNCIFGAGCQGVLTGPAPELAQGCCSYGAHFTGPDDVARVERAAATLGPETWQFAARARTPSGKLKILTRSKADPAKPDVEIVSRIVDDACIFLNRPDFPAGPGCALHLAALQRGERPMDLKPDVCWQLPLRREDETDATGHVTSTVRQWDRRHWGEGGAEFHWWCTEAPEAFSGQVPVFESLEAELIQLVGPSIYAIIAAELNRRRTPTAALPHPAVPVAQPRRRRANGNQG